MRSARGAALLVVVAVLAAVGFVFLAREGGGDPKNDTSKAPASDGGGADGDGKSVQAAPPPAGAVTLLGDGSTSVTGTQPNQMPIDKLKPGEVPPQFVVFSWDGVGEDSQRLFSHFRQVAKESDATMTLFLSGLYVLPPDKRALYHGPHHGVGESDIGFLDPDQVHDTIEQLGLAWQEGHEIGTHFNGHFCGPTGVGSWTAADWINETRQAVKFVQSWKTNTGFSDLPALPFDYEKELIGSRTPCLEGQKALLEAAPQLGFRYDSSAGGGRQVWPKQVNGIWDMPLQSLPFPGRTFEVLSMDYNIMVNQGNTTKGDPSNFAAWEKQAYEMFTSGFDRAYNGNRAPLIIGNHFESWNGGIYMKAVEKTMRTVCAKEGVRCVSFRQLVDWLDAQDPAVVAKLQELKVGQKTDWQALWNAPAPAPAPAPVTPAIPVQQMPPAVKSGT
ncbi:hypothetical protein [Yinghuangia sp. YIM S10712]|uniref:hypothetical protein n=1 Tax=Yinghuangia sp. YIM S10712 TaxID=3436930 RepID=UPI003F52ECF4